MKVRIIARYLIIAPDWMSMLAVIVAQISIVFIVIALLITENIVCDCGNADIRDIFYLSVTWMKLPFSPFPVQTVKLIVTKLKSFLVFLLSRFKPFSFVTSAFICSSATPRWEICFRLHCWKSKAASPHYNRKCRTLALCTDTAKLSFKAGKDKVNECILWWYMIGR